MRLYVFFYYKGNKSNLPFFREIYRSLSKIYIIKKVERDMNTATHRVTCGNLLIMN